MRLRNWFAGIAFLTLATALAFGQTGPIAITTTSLPDGSLGVPYLQLLSATSDIIGPPIIWSLGGGALPDGLNLLADGSIVGTPTTPGLANFVVQASQTTKRSTYSATQPLTILIPAPPLAISTSPALPPGSVGIAYTLQLTATGGVPQYSWSIVGGAFPDGVGIDAISGVISGTPTGAGAFTVQLSVSDQAGTQATGTFTLFVAPLLFISTAPALPSGSLNAPYALALTAAGGTPPYTWTVPEQAGTLPPGLKLDPTTGNLAGTPTTIGSYEFVVGVNDAAGQTASKALNLNITGLVAIDSTSPLPNGAVGSSYHLGLSASGGTPAYVWSILSGALAGGLTLDPATGVISGIPTATGSYQFVVGVKDATGLTASKPLTLNITALLAIATTSPLPNGAVGAAYQQLLSATGGTPGYTWSIITGTLPAGMTLNTATGSISGTPTAIGTYQFLVGVTDAARGTASKPLTLNITALPAIVTPSPLPNGAVGASYQLQLTAAGGTPPYTWSATSGALPAGLTLNPATGLLSGTPTVMGAYQILVVVTDALGQSGSKSLALNINAPSLTIVTPSPLPNGTVGTAYQQQLSAAGGTPPYAWSITAGALPAGVTLDPASGLLSGTPTAGGAFNVTVGVRDAVQTATQAYVLSISLSALPAVAITGLPDTPTPATQPPLGVSLSAAYTQDLTGHAALTFAPDSASDDPAVQFTTGGRSADFQIPTGTTQAVFASSTLGIQTGTVAGTITITLQILAAGLDVTPTPAPTKVLRIAPAPPVITSAKLTSITGGFDLLVIGFATSREVTGATVHLTPVSGTTLATSDFTIPLTTVFPVWYQDPASVQYGSQFSLHIPFGVQNATSAVGSLTVTLTNAQGNSAAANATF